ncbi:MAG: NIPSNAP family protein [Vicinamibacterales bacterium]
MNRREFVTRLATASACLAAGVSTSADAEGRATTGLQEKPVQFFELRRYLLRRGPHQGIIDEYMRSALIPAIQRAGGGPVGAFNVMIGAESPTLHVLIVHKTLDGFASLPDKLAADTAYRQAGAAYLNAAATDAAFIRIESSLMRAFSGMPSLELPFGGGEAGRRARIFELRTYESHSEEASKKKIEMFNSAEIAIFRRAGMMPVFFGETLVGPRLPNLTYMLVYEDMAAHDKQWSAFSADPEWRKLSTTPGLTDPDIVTNISNSYLRPTAYSQV